MSAFVFLRPGARAPVEGDAWGAPEGRAPGAWRAAVAGAPGVTVCTRSQLAWWIAEELWEVETEGPQRTAGHGTFVTRARLLRRIDGWAGPAWRVFLALCRERTRRLAEGSARPEVSAALLGTALRLRPERTAVAALVAALAAAAAVPAEDGEAERRRFVEERAVQSAWLGRALPV